MKTTTLLLASSFAIASAFAQDAAAPKRTLLKYTPPSSAKGGARVDGDGGSRGPDVVLPGISVLAPKEVGTTTSEHPSLFWYQTGPMPEKVLKTARVEVTIIDPKNPKPLVKVASALAADKQAGAGLHRLSLGKQNVTLEPGLTYKWSVALVPDPANRSQNVVASGSILRVAVAPELEAALKTAAPGDKAAIYAQNGVWYDAVEAISQEIDKAPENGELRGMRSQLLAQAGLKDAAASDKK